MGLNPFIKKIGKDSLVKIINGNSDVVALRPDNTTNIIKKILFLNGNKECNLNYFIILQYLEM